jgi:hypothetical protein
MQREIVLCCVILFRFPSWDRSNNLLPFFAFQYIEHSIFKNIILNLNSDFPVGCFFHR